MPFHKSQFEDTDSSAAYNPLTLLFLCSVWIASVGNAALWMELAKIGRLQSASDMWVALCLGLITGAALMLITALLAWRRSVKVVIAVALIATALGLHFMSSYGVVIDDTMMINVLQTDPRESRELLNWRLLLTVTVVALVPAGWLLRRPVTHLRWRSQLLRNAGVALLAGAVVALALLASFQGFSALMRNHKHLRYLINPLNSLYATVQVASKPLRAGAQPLQPIGLDAQITKSQDAEKKPPLLLIVLGETARAANFSFSGYARQTTPQIAQIAQSEALLYWRDAWSCGTNTAASLPCMFSHLGQSAFSDNRIRYENLLDVLQRAGIAVLWLDNQSGCKGVCDRIPNASTQQAKIDAHCSSEECHDLVMLHDLDARIAALPAQQRANGVVVVLHQMGSHGPAYFKRIPDAFRKFQPECLTNNLSQCSREQITNSYDNTLLYTDHLLAQSIAWLKAQRSAYRSAMFYLSDHGESLGENGIYLHGLPYFLAPTEQKHIPWINWFSPEFAAAQRLDTTCLQGQTQQRITHDHFFHSVLALMNVQTSVRNNALNLYKNCTPP